jgi:hypothetical protein
VILGAVLLPLLLHAHDAGGVTGVAGDLLGCGERGRVGGHLEAATVDQQDGAVHDERHHRQQQRHRECDDDQRLTPRRGRPAG